MCKAFWLGSSPAFRKKNMRAVGFGVRPTAEPMLLFGTTTVFKKGLESYEVWVSRLTILHVFCVVGSATHPSSIRIYCAVVSVPIGANEAAVQHVLRGILEGG